MNATDTITDEELSALIDASRNICLSYMPNECHVQTAGRFTAIGAGVDRNVYTHSATPNVVVKVCPFNDGRPNRHEIANWRTLREAGLGHLVPEHEERTVNGHTVLLVEMIEWSFDPTYPEDYASETARSYSTELYNRFKLLDLHANNINATVCGRVIVRDAGFPPSTY